MMKYVLLSLLTFWTFAGLPALCCSGWQEFRSSENFSVSYPRGWIRKGVSAKQLNILSEKGGSQGVVIKSGQGEIIVAKAKDSSSKTLQQVIEEYEKYGSMISRRRIQNKDAGARGCNELTEVVSKAPDVPPEDVPFSPPYIINTDYYCQVGRNTFVVIVRNYEGDKKQDQYQKIALRMARSIRILERINGVRVN